jgi:hypothetical protein
MPLHNRYQQRPTQREVDAYLEALEHELSQHRVPTNAPETPVQIETRDSGPYGLLWLVLLVGIGFFVGLLWIISY